MSPFKTLLEIDKRPRLARRFFGYRSEQLLVLGEASISHGGERVQKLFSRFVSNLIAVETLLSRASDDRSRVLAATAAQKAIAADSDLVEQRNGGLNFVILHAIEEKWRVLLLGAYTVALIQASGVREILRPHSAIRYLLDQGVPCAEAMEIPGVSTSAAVPGRGCEEDVDAAQLRISAKETLVALPEASDLARTGSLSSCPRTSEDISQVVRELTGGTGHRSQSWIAVLRS